MLTEPKGIRAFRNLIKQGLFPSLLLQYFELKLQFYFFKYDAEVDIEGSMKRVELFISWIVLGLFPVENIYL